MSGEFDLGVFTREDLVPELDNLLALLELEALLLRQCIRYILVGYRGASEIRAWRRRESRDLA